MEIVKVKYRVPSEDITEESWGLKLSSARRGWQEERAEEEEWGNVAGEVGKTSWRGRGVQNDQEDDQGRDG